MRYGIFGLQDTICRDFVHYEKKVFSKCHARCRFPAHSQIFEPLPSRGKSPNDHAFDTDCKARQGVPDKENERIAEIEF